MPLSKTNQPVVTETLSKQSNDLNAKLQTLIAALGCSKNIENITHCMIRLRFKLINDSLINQENIEKIQGVKGIVIAQGQTQIVIGTDVEKWFNAISNSGEQANNKSKTSNTEKKGNCSKVQCE